MKRQFSIGAMIGFCEWQKHKINVIDTPGYSNFAGDAKGCMSVMDGAVVVIHAEEGVQTQTEKVWNWAEEAGVRRLVFVNGMDRERADFNAALESAKEVLSPLPVALQVPIGAGPDFKGVADILSGKAFPLRNRRQRQDGRRGDPGGIGGYGFRSAGRPDGGRGGRRGRLAREVS